MVAKGLIQPTRLKVTSKPRRWRRGPHQAPAARIQHHTRPIVWGSPTLRGRIIGALARAFLRQAPIIILDEPRIWTHQPRGLTRFRPLTAGRTAIIITHRFTTAMQADVIHVMDAGQIVESGTHQELLALEGRYAQSWRAQMNGTVSSGFAMRI